MSRIFTRGTTTLIVCSHGIALFLEHMDDEQEPKISSEISPHINDKQLGRLNSYHKSTQECHNITDKPIISKTFRQHLGTLRSPTDFARYRLKFLAIYVNNTHFFVGFARAKLAVSIDFCTE